MANQTQEKINRRYKILLIIFIIAFIGIALQLINLQIVRGNEYAQLSTYKLLSERNVTAPRGKITDRNGNLIASNRMSFAVQIVDVKLKPAELNQMLLDLVHIFEKNTDTYIKTLDKYLTVNPLAFGPEISQSGTEMEKWKSELAKRPEDIRLMTTPEDAFKYLRSKFQINDRYNDEDAYKIMTLRYEMLIKGYTLARPLTLAEDVSIETVSAIEEKNFDFPGVSIDTRPVRTYIDAQPEGQVIGYVGGISDTEYEKRKGDGYGLNDIIGKAGIEYAAENYLRGIDGVNRLEVDKSGEIINGQEQNTAVPGNDVVLTLNTKLQKVAMDSLERNILSIRSQADGKTNFGDTIAGAAVAMDVNTGEILAMASYPSYDPSVFLKYSRNKDNQNIISSLLDPENKEKPLLNRVISGIYAPGSTFKPLIAVAGLEEGIITPQSTIRDTGVVNIGGRNFYSMEYRKGLGTMGNLDLQRALATSNNIYFHVLGSKIGIDNIDKWAELFGLGKKTGIDIPGESPGILASRDYKMKTFNDDWRPADTAQASIGQLYNAFTPLQLVNYVSAVANGGRLYTPHLIKKVVKYDGSIVTESKPEFQQLPVKPENILAIKKGMVAVTNSNDGTAVEAFKDFPYQVAGKTGTAETGAESNHSSNALFVAYAPAEKPEIAVAVVVERGVWGALTAPIARDILEEYFKTGQNLNN